MSGQLGRHTLLRSFAFAERVLTYNPFSLWNRDRTSSIRVVQELILEWRILDFPLWCQCLEWWRLLHRSLRSKVGFVIFFSLVARWTNCSRLFRFERELEALRKELADSAASRSGASTPPPGQGSPVMHTRTHSQYSHSEDEVSLSTAESPVILAHDLVAPMPPVDNLGLGLQSSSESSVDSVEKKQQ